MYEGPNDDDDDVAMPIYHQRCFNEATTGFCNNRSKCAHTHQAQLDKFGDDEISELPPNRKAVRAAKLLAKQALDTRKTTEQEN